MNIDSSNEKQQKSKNDNNMNDYLNLLYDNVSKKMQVIQMQVIKIQVIKKQEKTNNNIYLKN